MCLLYVYVIRQGPNQYIPLLCTHVDSYKFSTVHPPRFVSTYFRVVLHVALEEDKLSMVRLMVSLSRFGLTYTFLYTCYGEV